MGKIIGRFEGMGSLQALTLFLPPQSWTGCLSFFPFHAGEEALTMYMDKSRLDRKSGNATQSVEALHQLASSYFVDRDGTMRRLHEIQISTGAIKVRLAVDWGGRFLRQQHYRCSESQWADTIPGFIPTYLTVHRSD